MDRSAVLKGFWGCVKIKSSAMHDHLLLLEKGWLCYGKNLRGKEIGKGIRQRKDGRYEARITIKGSGNRLFLSMEQIFSR